MDLATLVLKSDSKALARAITIVENKDPIAHQLVKRLFPSTGRAFVIGITGPPGSGKSTLVDRMITEYRKIGKTVAVLAVDPTSPYTGGALLGDRVRMAKHNLDKRVFIRSMASRGDVGGLARAARDAVRIFDASGREVVIIETVGIGQTEFDIVKVAHATVVVLMPQIGDEIQAIKAGMMEIGDIFVLNKSDLQGADRAFYTLQAQVTERNGWRPRIIRTVAKTGKGINELLASIDDFRKFLQNAPNRSVIEREKIEEELIGIVEHDITESIVKKISRSEKLKEMVEKVLHKKIDPHSASRSLVREVLAELGWKT